MAKKNKNTIQTSSKRLTKTIKMKKKEENNAKNKIFIQVMKRKRNKEN